MTTSENILINIPFFKGWNVYINNKKEIIKVTEDGLISFKVSSGEHNIKLKFELTFIRKLSLLISFLSFVVIIITRVRDKI